MTNQLVTFNSPKLHRGFHHIVTSEADSVWLWLQTHLYHLKAAQFSRLFCFSDEIKIAAATLAYTAAVVVVEAVVPIENMTEVIRRVEREKMRRYIMM